MPRRYLHDDKPKPLPDETNGRLLVKVRRTNALGFSDTVEEATVSSETHPGGYYRDAQGRAIDAFGHLLEIGPDVDLSDGDNPNISVHALVNAGLADSPIVQQKLAVMRAKERRDAAAIAKGQLPRGIVQDSEADTRPPERDEDKREAEMHRRRVAREKAAQV